LFNRFLSNNLLLLIILSAIWGSAFLAIKIAVENIHPISIASLRLIIAAIFLYSYYKFSAYKIKFSKKNLILIFIIGLIGNFIPFFLISWSEQYIKSNTAGLLLSVAPIFTLFLSPLLTKDDKFTLRKLVSIIIGLIGVLFIIGFDSVFHGSISKDINIIPKIAIIVSALGYVFSAILAYNLNKINTLTLTTFVTIFAALTSLPFLIFSEFNNPSNINTFSLLPIFYLGLFPTAIAFLLRFHIISKAGPIFLSYVAYLIPVFAIFWGYIFLKETISINTFLGVILILLGVFFGRNFSIKTN